MNENGELRVKVDRPTDRVSGNGDTIPWQIQMDNTIKGLESMKDSPVKRQIICLAWWNSGWFSAAKKRKLNDAEEDMKNRLNTLEKNLGSWCPQDESLLAPACNWLERSGWRVNRRIKGSPT